MALATLVIAPAAPTRAQSMDELRRLSVEDLSQVEITSVSKRPEPLSVAPAAVYVITADQIRRSGAATLAEALRLAPNLEVARVNSQVYAISSRGLNSVNASNKLLVLIDGRSVYTPFFSSVFWDQQDMMIADIERIEVISGPGGALWGANAMNGVVNVVTRSAADTQGGLVDAQAGNFLQRATTRWGGSIEGGGSYRFYAVGSWQGDTTLATTGANAMDSWHGAQAGFRADAPLSGGVVTLIGDAYENIVDWPGGRRNGGDLLARWTRQLADGSSLQVQAYYDQQSRSDAAATGGGSADRVNTFDLQAQYSFAIGKSQQIVWGAGYRSWKDEFTNTANPFILVPQSERLSISNVFAQDTVALSDALKLTAGVKFEYSTFTGWATMPSVRLGWQSDEHDFLWAAVSRAVRPPSRLERDLTAPGIVNQSPDFQSEKLIAYEAGWRAQLLPEATVSVSLFYNDYSDLRTTSPNPVTVLPVTFGNGLEGHTYGLDAWGTYSPVSWWRLSPGVELLRKSFRLKPGQSDIAGIQTVLGHDPKHQLFLRSYMDLPNDWQLYIGLRQIGKLPSINVPAYFEADVRLAWRPVPNVELSLVGQDLVHARHAEATQPPVHDIPRNYYFGVRWSF